MADVARSDGGGCTIVSDAQVLRLNPELVTDTPSRRHAVSSGEETAMRAYGCELIQHAAIQMNLSTSACGTAQILFHRFYYRQSMRKYVDPPFPQ